jgi:enoyl-CoA hydratase/carnithine racemase
MTATKLSVSVPSELLARAERVLARPGEGRSALITRLMAEAVRAAEEAEIDAAYERAYARRPIRQADLERTDAIARAALRSTTEAGEPSSP